VTRTPVIAIYDVGKTNKKVLLFNEQYKIVFEESRQLPGTTDEDGFPCEDVVGLTAWVRDSFQRLSRDEQFGIRAVNFSGYGASFVYLDQALNLIPPLYNYLKPYPAELQETFYASYGGENLVARETASPVLGSLNSGLQLYRLKYEKPVKFREIKWALHLPQYLSFILTSSVHADITSVGCHTHLWDFSRHRYHRWVSAEGIDHKMAPLVDCTRIVGYTPENIPAGPGLHDSSAALIPYQASFSQPFILLSTGTWCISLNPFTALPLTDAELRRDCLCYLAYDGKAVKASRLFAGFEHEQQVKRLSSYFEKPVEYYTQVECDKALIKQLGAQRQRGTQKDAILEQPGFEQTDPEMYPTFEAAYHHLVITIVEKQIESTELVMQGSPVKRIFVDGGFSKNPIYMYLLAEAFPGIEVYAASVPQASALGAALAIHRHWNSSPLPDHLIGLDPYAASE
jgi:sugar (pentulose or hexulose) kinase